MLEWLAEVGYLPCLERKMWVHTSAAEPNMRRDRLGKEKLQRVVKSAPRKSESWTVGFRLREVANCFMNREESRSDDISTRESRASGQFKLRRR